MISHVICPAHNVLKYTLRNDLTPPALTEKLQNKIVKKINIYHINNAVLLEAVCTEFIVQGCVQNVDLLFTLCTTTVYLV